MGVPAIFLRLAGCNLECSGFSYHDPVSNVHLGCDTKLLWRQGTRQDFSDIISHWQAQSWFTALQQGAHLVITGGEPLLQQRRLIAFIAYLDALIGTVSRSPVFVEMETNGTIMPERGLLERVNQFNVSPKLAHSGETREKAYHAAILQSWVACEQAIFKFVIAHPSDVTELIQDYIHPFSISPRRVWLMPEGGTPTDIDAKKAWIVEACKQHVFNFSSRLQIDIWSQVVGV